MDHIAKPEAVAADVALALHDDTAGRVPRTDDLLSSYAVSRAQAEEAIRVLAAAGLHPGSPPGTGAGRRENELLTLLAATACCWDIAWERVPGVTGEQGAAYMADRFIGHVRRMRLGREPVPGAVGEAALLLAKTRPHRTGVAGASANPCPGGRDPAVPGGEPETGGLSETQHRKLPATVDPQHWHITELSGELIDYGSGWRRIGTAFIRRDLERGQLTGNEQPGPSERYRAWRQAWYREITEHTLQFEIIGKRAGELLVCYEGGHVVGGGPVSRRDERYFWVSSSAFDGAEFWGVGGQHRMYGRYPVPRREPGNEAPGLSASPLAGIWAGVPDASWMVARPRTATSRDFPNRVYPSAKGSRRA